MANAYGGPKVRLIFSPDLCRTERGAVLDATRAFAKFNVSFDHVVGQKSLAEIAPRGIVRTKTDARIRQAGYGESINDLVTKETVFYHDVTALFSKRDRLADVYTRKCLGMGVTPYEINGWIEQINRFTSYPGITRTGEVGIVSTYLELDLAPRLKQAVICAVAKHELGHLLGKDSHCKGTRGNKCLMEAWVVNERFIKEVVEGGLDFCKKCENTISKWIGSYGKGGRA